MSGEAQGVINPENNQVADVDPGAESISFIPAIVAEETTDEIDEDNIDVDPAEIEKAGIETPEDPEKKDEEKPTVEEPAEEEKPQKKTNVEKRIDKLTRKFYDAQRRADKLEAELKVRNEQSQPASEPETQSDPPKEEDFETYEAFVDAKIAYGIETGIKQYEQTRSIESKKQAETAKVTTQQKTTAGAIQSFFSSGEQKYPGFTEAAQDDDLLISVPMRDAMLDSKDHGIDIMHYLAQNPTEAERISSLRAVGAIREIGKIEHQIINKSKQTPTKTKAPAPIKPVGTSASPSKDPIKMTNAEYRAYRGLTSRGQPKG